MVASRIARSRWRATLAGACLLVAACAAVDVEPPASRSALPAGVLSPWMSVSGGWLAGPPSAGGAVPPAFPPVAGPTLRQVLMRPVSVAARGDDVYVADAGTRALYRYVRSADRLQVLAALGPVRPGMALGLAVDAGRSVYVADPASGRAYALDPAGRLRTNYAAPHAQPMPVAIAVVGPRADVLVADGALQRVIRYNALGRPIGELPSDRVRFGEIVDLKTGPRGVYVLDRAARQIVVFERGEVFADAYAVDEAADPTALAVDRSGRVYVLDAADQTIVVYANGMPITRFGGIGSVPGRFVQATSIDADENLVYVADAGNARVQLLLAAPESMRPR